MAAEQLELLGAPLAVAGAVGRSVIVHSHVRRLASQRRAVGAIPAPIPEAVLERTDWLAEQMDGWRKAQHAATQARSEGASFRKTAAIAEPLGTAAPWHARAEAAFQRAEAHEALASARFAAINARLR